MNFKRNLPLLFLAAVLCGVIVYLFMQQPQRVVYIDTIQLFNEFSYKKDMEHSYEATLTKSKNHYDSIAALCRLHPENMELNDLLKQEEHRFTAVYEQIKSTITEKSWERLDPLIKEFGASHKYDLLIGANGMGTVLYGSQPYDKTQELIDFVNNKYERNN